MTIKIVTDEQYGQISRRANEVVLRASRGAIDFNATMDGLQFLVEGKKVEPIGVEKTNWIQEIIKRERQCHFDFFGQEIDLSEFENTLKKYGRQKIRRWQKLGMEPHFLPQASMMSDDDYSGWKIKLEKWFYKQQSKGKIFRDINGILTMVKTIELEGVTVLIDTRLKPSYYYDGSQMYKNDNLLGFIIKTLRSAGNIAKYEYGSQDSRFGVSPDEWEKDIKPSLAGRLDLKESQIRLELAIEANVIPQLYPYMPRKDDGNTNTSVYFEEYFEEYSEDRGYCRFIGGDSDNRGLANVNQSNVDSHWEHRSIRPLAVL